MNRFFLKSKSSDSWLNFSSGHWMSDERSEPSRNSRVIDRWNHDSLPITIVLQIVCVYVSNIFR